MDYRRTAKEILNAAGGKENIVSAAHCATRLRIVIADNGKADRAALENIEGVKGVFEASGQLQVIIGTGSVNKVFDEFAAFAGVEASTKEDVKRAAAAKMPWYQRAVRTLGDIFVPIIPAIVASGLLMGLLEGFTNLYPNLAGSDTYVIFHLFSNAAFVFLPILIAVSAAKAFGGNPYLGAVIGMIMIHSDLMNAWSVAGAESVPSAEVWFGLYQINLVGYQGHVIPVVIAVWFMSMIEKRLHKIVPEMLDLFITPLVTVLVTGYCTLTILGPVFGYLENGILLAVKRLISVPYGIGGALCGLIYAPTVVGGIHHMYNALEAGLLSAEGINTWMPVATAANVAQGAAALAFSIRTKDKKQRAVAFPASLSAFLGITEPAIFGVNLRFLRPFIAGCIGGLAGGLVAGWLQVGATAYGITGVFGLLITTHNILQYLLVMAAAFVTAFCMTMILYREKEGAEGTGQEHAAEPDNPEKAGVAETKAAAETEKTGAAETRAAADVKGTKAADNGEITVLSPMDGGVVPLSEVPDETFSSGVLGGGAAIRPSGGVVKAPGDGVVSMLFDTRHAIGITLDNGVELLIHIGINTVEMGGEGFYAHVKAGDRVRAGSELVTFDRELIQKSGHDTVTPVLVSNWDDYESVDACAAGEVRALDHLFKMKKKNEKQE